MGSFATNYEEIVAVLLFVIGMSNLVFQPNLLKKIIGMDIMDTAVYLFLTIYHSGRVPHPRRWILHVPVLLYSPGSSNDR